MGNLKRDIKRLIKLVRNPNTQDLDEEIIILLRRIIANDVEDIIQVKRETFRQLKKK